MSASATTTRTSKSGVVTTTVRERFTPPDWHADGWFLERRHPAEWSRRTELVVPDHDQAAAVDPLVGVHDELRKHSLSRSDSSMPSKPRSSLLSQGDDPARRFLCPSEQSGRTRAYERNHGAYAARPSQ